MEEQNKIEEQTIVKKKESVLENANKWYAFYPKLPKIVLIATLVIFFIWGIIDPCVFGYEGGIYLSKVSYYGIMGLESGFVAWLIWQLIGGVVAFMNYVMLKLMLAPMVLQTECLKEIKENTKKESSNLD